MGADRPCIRAAALRPQGVALALALIIALTLAVILTLTLAPALTLALALTLTLFLVQGGAAGPHYGSGLRLPRTLAGRALLRATLRGNALSKPRPVRPATSAQPADWLRLAEGARGSLG